MNIYLFDENTKEYIGTDYTDIDPIETKRRGKDIYLMPPNATDIAPPETQENQVAVWDDGWQIKDDFRGTEYWLADDGHYSEPRKMTEIGSLPDGAVLVRPDKTQAEINSERAVEIKSKLTAIDLESLRPLRALANGVLTDYDIDKLASLEAEAVELRAELATLKEAT